MRLSKQSLRTTALNSVQSKFKLKILFVAKIWCKIRIFTLFTCVHNYQIDEFCEVVTFCFSRYLQFRDSILLLNLVELLLNQRFENVELDCKTLQLVKRSRL